MKIFIVKKECHKCGRKGHWTNKCYAKTDIDGDYIHKKLN